MFEDVITVYRFINNKYIRSVIENVYYEECKQSNINKSGLVTSNSVKIIIPTEDDIKFTNGKDLIILGNIDFEFDNTDQSKQSASKKELSSKYDVVTVNIVDKYKHGDLKHIQLGCN